ncbi:CDC45 family [Russula brevipes]|nr:CDC45 family [Russula brevipes]
MVFVPPPHLASASRQSYADAYNNILAAHRRSPLSAASSVIILVAPDVDALCAAKMFAELFKQDDVMHRITPLSGIADLERMRDELVTYSELHTLILLNIGSILDLPSSEWFGDFPPKVHVHVIDSGRPQNLSSLFGEVEGAERIIVWDDGGAEHLDEERRAWETLNNDPEPDSDESSDDGSSEDMPEDSAGEGVQSPSRKRRSLDDGGKSPIKRKRFDDDRRPRVSREQRDKYYALLDKYYMSGTWYGQSAAGIVYLLATALERVDNDLLWLAILGLTNQYTRCRMSLSRLNPPPPANDAHGLAALSADDMSLRTTDELRFELFRHWTLYDAMFHSSYVAGKLGIWKEQGRRRLAGLLAKMGFSVPQTQQLYAHMDMDLKRQLRDKLDAIAPEYGMIELTYPSFVRCYGYHMQPLSAADGVDALNALLDAATGWFGGGRVWRAGGRWGATGAKEKAGARGPGQEGEHTTGEGEGEEEGRESCLVRNFWIAFDALEDATRLHEAIGLAKANDIRTIRDHRVVQLKQGPDLALFTQPGVLFRLGLWLTEVLRDRVKGVNISRRSKKKSLPLVLACLDEQNRTYLVIGLNESIDFGDVRKNEFGLTFLDAKEDSGARTRHSSFDTNVLVVNEADFEKFIAEVYKAKDKY